jgi:hypothetical protein
MSPCMELPMEMTINSTVKVEQSNMDQNNVSQDRCELNGESKIGFRGCFEFRNRFIHSAASLCVPSQTGPTSSRPGFTRRLSSVTGAWASSHENPAGRHNTSKKLCRPDPYEKGLGGAICG